MSDTDRESPTNEALLRVDDLVTHIETDHGTIHAVDGVSFEVNRGEVVCIVGESGSGKSVTCESLTRIVPRPPAVIKGGTVEFDGVALDGLDEKHIRRFRGNRIAHVFQNPQSALDPVYTVGEQIIEAMAIHESVDDKTARRRAIDLLRQVGIPGASKRVDEYPHEFSGGMKQRAAIAIALAAEPDLLIADEPTTAVDVTVQARLIELLRGLTAGGMSILWITHDLRVVASIADRVLVMFGGTIVERGSVEDVFSRPAHPYTQALFQSYDGLSRAEARQAREDIPTDGCRFRDQCDFAIDACAGGDQPAFEPVSGSEDHRAACVHYGPEGDPEPILERAEDARPGARVIDDV
ncbi:MAG: ABC transporter ATP-binding protein [Halobacteriota archaeon]